MRGTVLLTSATIPPAQASVCNHPSESYKQHDEAHIPSPTSGHPLATVESILFGPDTSSVHHPATVSIRPFTLSALLTCWHAFLEPNHCWKSTLSQAMRPKRPSYRYPSTSYLPPHTCGLAGLLGRKTPVRANPLYLSSIGLSAMPTRLLGVLDLHRGVLPSKSFRPRLWR